MDYIIISHIGWPYQLWSGFITVLELTSAFTYAIQAAYRHSVPSQYWATVELIFLLDMFIHFILDYRTNHKTVKIYIRSWNKIVMRYYHGDFFYDMIPLIPFQILNLENNFQNVFFAIKVFRIRKGIKKTSIPKIIMWLKD